MEINSNAKLIVKRTYLMFESIVNPRFYKLRKKTNGMLLPIVYKKLYKLCTQLPDLDIVEIGGATGAGSVSIAWALRDTQKRSNLIVVEKCEGGTRTDIGGYEDNLKLIQQHFASFKADEKIVLFPHELTFENGAEVLSLIQTPRIAAFIHDADGRIDRDFYLFWRCLQPGGLIVVDDYANEPKYKPISDRHPQGGAKSVITYRLLNQIMEWGLFQPTEQIGKTIFGIKPLVADFDRFDLAKCQSIIEEVHQERNRVLESKRQLVKQN